MLYTSFLTQDWVKPALIYLKKEKYKKKKKKNHKKKKKHKFVSVEKSVQTCASWRAVQNATTRGRQYIPVLMNICCFSFTIWCFYAAHWCISALNGNNLLYLETKVLFYYIVFLYGHLSYFWAPLNVWTLLSLTILFCILYFYFHSGTGMHVSPHMTVCFYSPLSLSCGTNINQRLLTWLYMNDTVSRPSPPHCLASNPSCTLSPSIHL